MSYGLNKLYPDPAYHCGRIVAVLAFVQELALGEVNAGVVRRYLSAASKNPSRHIGRLQIDAEKGHFHKLREKTAQFLRDELKEISGSIPPSQMPNTLRPDETSLFVLGFYHELAYVERGRFADRKLHRTRRGEWVESRGEKRLADALHGLGVPYCYEPRFSIKSGHRKSRIPDFMIPSTTESGNVYIEWLGVNGPDGKRYAEEWVKKLEDYQGEGLTPEGGESGKLLWIDDRDEPSVWDDKRVIQQLVEWFPEYAA